MPYPFPGMEYLGSKDTLWKYYERAQRRFGEEDYNFHPKSYLYPADKAVFKDAWQSAGPGAKWIVKPPAVRLFIQSAWS